MKNFCLILTILFLCVCSSYSQITHKEIYIHFRVNSTVIDTAYLDNTVCLQEINSLLQAIEQDTTTRLVEVVFCGVASPEGSDQHNRKLAAGRVKAIEKYIRSRINIPDSIVARDEAHIDWEYLELEVRKSNLKYKDTIISVLQEEPDFVDYHHINTHIDSRIPKLQKMYDGVVWEQISKYFLRMRSASVIVVTYRKPVPSAHEIIADTSSVASIMDGIEIYPTPADVTSFGQEPPAWTRKLRFKTNLLGLSLSIANLEAEIDLDKHWSVALPVYYSAVNYFKRTIKFRTFLLQPEVRYWLSEDNDGFYTGAHLGMAYFNVASDGLFRYQSHKPILGGGLSVGYRISLGKKKHWSIDVSAGAGVYSIYYDRFVNVENGMWLDSNRFTYIGVDHLSVSLAYAFDISKRKKNDKK